LLSNYESLFNGHLGHWQDDEYNIDLQEGAKSYHAKAFPIPYVHLETRKAEVQPLCDLGVLKRVNHSEWAAPTFIIPKKDGSVCFISDFRELNKRSKRKLYHIPKIQNLLMQLEGFQYASSLDLNLSYYHIELSPDAKKLCTKVLPFGKFEYQRLPMGLCNSPDIFQEKMFNLMMDLEYVRAYIDDLLVTTKGSFEDQVQKLERVLNRLEDAGLNVNATKSFFAREGLEYLGYWISRDGIQPLTAKVEAI
jgi:Reverse transcriptase (RNA-dependent DNA polymerase)